jgi:hypothetical protein
LDSSRSVDDMEACLAIYSVVAPPGYFANRGTALNDGLRPDQSNQADQFTLIAAENLGRQILAGLAPKPSVASSRLRAFARSLVWLTKT